MREIKAYAALRPYGPLAPLHLRSGKAYYRVPLVDRFTKSQSEAMSRRQEEPEAALQAV